MPAPTQIAGSPFQTTWTTGSPKTAVVGAVGVGDLIVVAAAAEDTANVVFVTPTNTAASPATITWTARGSVTTAARCTAGGWTGLVTVAGNLTISESPGGSSPSSANWGFAAWVFASANHGGVGLVPAGSTSTASAPTLTASWAANSLICCVNGDWTAVSHGGTRSYRTGAGTATEVNYAAVGSNYTTEAWYHATTGAGGSQAVGLTTPNMTWSLVEIEVLGPAAGGGTVVKKLAALGVG